MVLAGVDFDSSSDVVNDESKDPTEKRDCEEYDLVGHHNTEWEGTHLDRLQSKLTIKGEVQISTTKPAKAREALG